MLTKYLTSVTTTFSPFNPRSGKTARNFLALLPPNARSTMAINITMLPKAQADAPASLAVKFSTFQHLAKKLGLR
jgi:large subunit ribosomal protein L53